jgi:hypothetical protein
MLWRTRTRSPTMFLCLYAARLGRRSSKASLESTCHVAICNLSVISCEDYYGCSAWDLVGHSAAAAGNNTHRNVAPFHLKRSNRHGSDETHVVSPVRPTVGLSRPRQPDGVCLANRGVLVF